VVLVAVFNFQQAAQIALVALAISPLPPLLPSKETRAVGHASYGLALMAILALLAIATVPLSAQILEAIFGREFKVSATTIARIVLVAMVIPLLAGMTMRAMMPALTERIGPIVPLAAKILLALAAIVLFVAMWRAILGAIGGGAILSMVIFVVLALIIGDVLVTPTAVIPWCSRFRAPRATPPSRCRSRRPTFPMSTSPAPFFSTCWSTLSSAWRTSNGARRRQPRLSSSDACLLDRQPRRTRHG
jgi:predicted Na+-dependent transporter